MLPDPVTLMYSAGRIAKHAHRFKTLDKEMRVYISALDDTSVLVSEVASEMSQTWINPDIKTRIGHTIQQAISALENARRLINSEEIAQGGIRETKAKMEWMLQYKPYKELVRQYHETLLGYKRDLSAVSEGRRSLEESFKEKRHVMFAALAMRMSRTETRYSDTEGQGQVARNTAIRDWTWTTTDPA